eukprot:COSAG02_NODE_7497_length_2985_cov_1.417533_3_plen_63_part_00
MVLAALLLIRNCKCNFLYEFVRICMYIRMSYQCSKYEFVGRIHEESGVVRRYDSVLIPVMQP